MAGAEEITALLTEKLGWSGCARSDGGHPLHNPETQDEDLGRLSGRSLKGEVSGYKQLGGGICH